MGLETTKVWEPMRKAVRKRGFFVRIESTAGNGQSDVHYCIIGVSGWVELKHMHKWPALESTKTTLGIRRTQKIWLEQHLVNGGKSFVFVRVGEEWLLIPVYAGLDKATRKEWESRALIHTANGMDWDRLMDILSH